MPFKEQMLHKDIKQKITNCLIFWLLFGWVRQNLPLKTWIFEKTSIPCELLDCQYIVIPVNQLINEFYIIFWRWNNQFYKLVMSIKSCYNRSQRSRVWPVALSVRWLIEVQQRKNNDLTYPNPLPAIGYTRCWRLLSCMITWWNS
jgi:hypothetical protein